MKLLNRLLAAFAVLLAGLALPAAAQVDVRVTEGTFKPRPIAVPDFKAVTPESEQYARQISEVIRADLVSSGLFEMIDPNAFTQTDLDVSVQPRFADWRVVNAEALVVGEVELMANNRLRVAFRLWDNYAEEVMMLEGQTGRQFGTGADDWRRLAHKVADSIYTRITGEDGYFDTRIIFIAESGPKTNRVKRLAKMDQDGADVEYLTDGIYQMLTPRFSPSAQIITYMSFEGGKPRVYLYNTLTGLQEVLGNFPGMTFAPRFSPDGNSVLLSQAQDGNTDLYIMDLRTRQSRRLTDHPAIDTSPSMAPEGDKIVFASDRGGTVQLYIMNANGSMMNCPSGGRDTACRLTYDKGGRGRYSTPVWSPRGDWIAFTKQSQGRFYIGVIRPDGSGERLLTESYLDEGPTWSPNGRVIAFFRENSPGANPELWTVDLTGRNLRKMPYSGAASDPAWSPLLR